MSNSSNPSNSEICPKNSKIRSSIAKINQREIPRTPRFLKIRRKNSKIRWSIVKVYIEQIEPFESWKFAKEFQKSVHRLPESMRNPSNTSNSGNSQKNSKTVNRLLKSNSNISNPSNPKNLPNKKNREFVVWLPESMWNPSKH